MKLRIARTMMVAAVALAFTSAAYGQELNVRAKVPFEFVLGDKLYPAGEYSVQAVAADIKFIVSIKSEDPKLELKPEPALASVQLHRTLLPAKSTELIFHRIGNTYFLYQVWVADSAVGREFPRSKTETRMAMNGTKAETVTVAANIAR
jgi:hypothetical protein